MRKWKLIVKEALSQTLTVAKFLCLLHVTDNYLCSPTLVYGPSMLPTLNLTGDVVLSEHVSHRLGRVGPGDIVLVRSPLDPTKFVTKRVGGVEGDRVTFLEPRISDTCRTFVVPKGHVWIQGDNIYASNDSRHFGPVPYGLIQGKAFFRVWPPYCFGSLGP
ncbi:mitochondrial inner membrane protease subunit 1 [Melia azedarach]|uniref:Mitochondrial inner membrane protease subunit 1 n=1 Tax=Melia azedarach TaxID=155640 RepID=A0ACC1YS51_MELAZ|nr:mitochondrial inner membrane protease subunit 1 [Melia azedarach]